MMKEYLLRSLTLAQVLVNVAWSHICDVCWFVRLFKITLYLNLSYYSLNCFLSSLVVYGVHRYTYIKAI